MKKNKLKSDNADPVSSVVMSNCERDKILTVFNDTAIDYPSDKTLLDLFYKQVALRPDSEVLIFKDREYTYRELNETSNQFGAYLRENYDIRPDDLICLKLERSEKLILSILATLKSGGAYVPIDPGYPESRIKYIEEDSKCKVMIDESEFTKFTEVQSKYSKENIQPDTLPTNLAYVIYTSGSTGKPKGCMLEHRGVINRIEWMWKKYNFTVEDRILQKTTYTFDVSVWELFMPLCWGTKMVLCQREDISSPERIIKLIKTQNVTCLHFVPSMLNAFIRIGFSNPELSTDLITLKRVITSGEALSLETVKNWYSRLDVVIQNLYGPTEASVDVTYFETSKNDKSIPIGKAIDNTQMYILDTNLEPVPIGEMGEVCIGGIGLARGYLNKPELTAEKFIPNPFIEKERIYLTGDLGKFLDDGNIEYLGRKDNQVKVRGFRIELGEIEKVLEKYELIDEVIVLAKPDKTGEKELVMYYVPDMDKGYTIRKILENANRGLPERVELQELPNGMSLYTYNKTELEFLFEEIFEDKIYFKHGIAVPDDGCVVDIGANLGMFTICSNLIANNVDIYSFEPLPPTFELLKLNSSIYKNKINLFNCGISNKEETVTFKYYPNATILSSRYSEEEEVAETVKQFILNSEDFDADKLSDEDVQNILKDRLVTQEYDCVLKTLSQVIKEEGIKQIDLLKIDVEKCELDVLEGIEENDWKKIKQVVLEVYDSNGRLAYITELLQKHGFKVFVEQDAAVTETKLYDLFALSSDLVSGSGYKPNECRIKDRNSLGLKGLREGIKSFANKELPEYMVPSYFVELEEIPLTSNGKANRKALLALDSSSVIYQDYVAPENDIEKLMVNLWEKVLGREKIGVKDSFFELGGHSLKAVQVVNLMNEAGYQLELKDFMANKTIQEISLLVSEKKQGSVSSEIVRIERNRDFYDITETQQELWLLDKLDSSKREHNILFRCDFEKSTDIGLLSKSLNIIFKQYESFHSVFCSEDGMPVQKILKYKNITIHVINENLEEVIHGLKQIKIDIEKGPLFYLKFVEQKNKYVLLINLHHIIFDGWSLGVFMEKIKEVYSALQKSKDYVPEEEIQNVDFAKWQKNVEHNIEKQLTFWKKNLIPFAPELNLPTKIDRPKIFSTEGIRYWFDIDKTLTEKLEQFAKDNSVTLFSLLLCAYKLLLAKHTGQSDIVIGTPYANRKNIQQESLIGYYSNMVAIRSVISKDLQFKDLMSSVNMNAMNAFSNSDISFGSLVKKLNCPKDHSRTPIYQAMFVMQNWHGDDVNSTLHIDQKELGVNTVKTDITLNSEAVKDGLEFWFEYNEELFSEELIVDLKKDFIEILNNVNAKKEIKSTENKKTCFILTETTLGIRCAEELLKNDYHIYGIISPNPQVRNWAVENSIYTADLNKKELTKLLQKYPYEYLFSIVNGIILDDEILKTPQKYAINYHDSLLPKYAGVYASFWAILNNEKKHGITWHIVDGGIDTGEIIKQKEVKLTKNETSISLNAKCYEAAYSAFIDMVSDIENDSFDSKKQDTSLRTYNGLYKRPANMGIFSPADSPEENRRIFNALSFGDHENPIATPKVLIDGKYYVVSDVTDAGIIADYLVSGEKLKEQKSFEFSCLSEPDKHDAAELVNSAKTENYWFNKLLSFEPIEFSQNDFEVDENNKYLRTTHKKLPEYLLFLARLSGLENFFVKLELKHTEHDNLISSEIPFKVNADFNKTFEENLKEINAELECVTVKTSFAKDIFHRYSELNNICDLYRQWRIPEFDKLFAAFYANSKNTAKLKDISLIPENELIDMEKWNITATDFSAESNENPLEQTYQSLFESRMQKYKNSQAVSFKGEFLTYENLNIKVNQFAEYLRTQGVTKNSPVGICMDRSLTAVVSMLGIVKAGGAYMPIDPDYPVDRKKFMLDDSGAKILLTDEHLINSLPETDAEIIYPATNWDELTKGISGTSNISNINSPEDTFYIIYTSGSTGKPKGVQITHRNILNHNFSVIRDFALNANDRVMQFGSISFDLSAEEIFPTLLIGAELFLRTDEVLSSMKQFLNFVNTNKISVLDLPTAFWHEFVDSLKDNSMPKSVKLVIIGGEKASSEKMRRWLDYTKSKVRLLNTYGPTETTIIASMCECSESMISDEFPIGRPIANTQLYILDQFLQQVPVGVSGELYIGGENVGKGYLNRPDLTSEKFISDPFSQNKNDRLYKTGDLVKYRPDGNINFVGRVDTQVKIRGFRIEPGEIESAMLSLDSVKDVTVIVREEQSDKVLTAYYVLHVHGRENTEDLKSSMQELLPDYMIPALFMELDKIPLTPNGKVDKKNLPLPNTDNLYSNTEFVSPETKTEKRIAKIFSEVLHIKKVSLEDSFFALGGHSLSALQVVSRLDKTFKQKCQVSTIFDNPSIKKLAEHIENSTVVSPEDNKITRYETPGIIPLSFSQKRIWFLDKYDGSENRTYNVPITFGLKGKLDIETLKQSFNVLIERHHSLRTSFPETNGIPRAELSDLFEIDISVENTSKENLDFMLLEKFQHKFNVAELPLFKVSILKLSDNNQIVMMNFHHIICDGWSIKNLIEELNIVYTAMSSNKNCSLTELPIQYSDFAVWQSGQNETEDFKKQLDYWERQLNDCTDLELPSDFTRPAEQKYNGDIVRFNIGKKLLSDIKSLTNKNDSSLFMFFMTLFNILLKRYTGVDDIVVGTPVASRNDKDLESVIGVFINSLALRNNLSGDVTFNDLLLRVKKTSLDAFDNQDVSIELLIDLLKVKRDSSKSPIFQVMMILQNASNDVHLEFPELEEFDYKFNPKVSKFDLTLMLEENNGTIEAGFEYNTDLYRIETIERMAGHYLQLLKSVLKNPESNINYLDILTPVEHKLLLKKWNDTAVAIPNKDICELIEEKCIEYAAKTAVICGDLKLTYSELSEKSNRLANYLIHKSVKPGDYVGIYMNRSIDMLVSLIAVWKSGCAYIPLDPSFPSDRLEYMIKDSNPKIIITEKQLGNSTILNSKNIIVLDTEWDNMMNIKSSSPGITYTFDTPAYVIYTSGSTGKPKGVILSHVNMLNFLLSMQKSPGMNKDDIILAITTLSFDIAVLELYLPLITGAQIILATAEDVLDSFKLIELMNEHDTTMLQATPSSWKMLLDANWNGNPNLKALTGGEPITPPLAKELLKRSNELWNMYGPTETTVWSTIHKIKDSKPPILVGCPIDNTQIYVLDTYKNPVPVGVSGNLFIGGEGVASGYLNRPELTSEKFIQNPLSSDVDDIVYETGDIGKFNSKGILECLGRSDFQVKISGHRIELGEIASELLKIDSINDAVVDVYMDANQVKRLVGYLILNNNEEVSQADIKNKLKTALPDYMVPNFYMTMDSFPLTPNGKTDRKKLPKPKDMGKTSETNYVIPYTPIQEVLCDCYQTLLNVKKIGINDNFFELGGDSLLTIQVIDTLNKAGLKLRVEQIFKYHSIEDLAEAISKSESSVSNSIGSSCLIELQKGKKGENPFYLIHTPPGDLLGYVNLVKGLDNDIPVYGFRSIGLDDGDLCHKTIPDMASYYIKKLLEIQPKGPYFLGGWCLGGTVAFEMAQQLSQKGHKIELLAVFDSIGLKPKDKKLKFKYNLSRIGGFSLSGPKKWMGYVRGKLKSKLNDEMDDIINNDNSFKDIGIFKNRSVVRINNMNAAIAYRTEFYNGEVSVFIAEEQHPAIMPHPQLSWTTLAEEITVISTPGKHETLLKPPNVKKLAENLNKLIKSKSIRQKQKT